MVVGREEKVVWVRVLFGVFLIGHAMGHATWPLAAFAPGVYKDEGRRDPLLGSGPADGGLLGRAPGVVGVAVLGCFLAAAVGLFQRADWWEPRALGGSAASGVRALLWWSPVGAVSIPALLADLGVFLVILLPIGERITEAG